MTQAAQAPVRETYAGTDDEEFSRLTEPFRRELLAHCYRMLGSTHDAQDVVQDTYLRAWRGFSGFEGRSSLRVWLYRIATSACLTTLKHRNRRVLPSGLGPSGDPDQPLTVAGPDVAWVHPLPEAELPVTDPAAIVTTRSSVRLALVAALQYLPARQRAVLILRDVLAWHASEVAELLDTTTDAVNSALARARAHLARTGLTEDMFTEPADPADRMLLDRYARAFQNADTAALLQVLREDVTMEMPPHLTWFAGRDAVIRFLTTTVFGRVGTIRTIPARANGQPALATYTQGTEGLYHPHSLHVLTPTRTGVSRIVSFHDPSLFAPGGLPTRIDETSRPVAGR
ncbi:sigma-70 family RNA polymerase sigma factor [Micromonospora foliorum]|uniref:sigma-70 family RNA polymerase sigma factor n=1 Tax=Micromonospora foliorum TaxID=2911210 RepID=UPI001EE8EC84|nr:sigma-70 family RNA polymerase sigma factor [Micromonospora foliorum]MCG5434790.1 sigma-70 family RNA polymerase sigma factor [Micromonospora foliorum]